MVLAGRKTTLNILETNKIAHCLQVGENCPGRTLGWPLSTSGPSTPHFPPLGVALPGGPVALFQITCTFADS